MKGLLKAVINRIRRRPTPVEPSTTPIAPPPVTAPDPRELPTQRDRQVAQQLCDSLDRAMELGLWSHADRVAATALRLAPTHAGLTERLARLRLVQGNAETALALLETCTVRRASLRLLRAVCLIQVGRREEAHADLNRWSRRSSAPLDARRLLALLDWAAGDCYGAVSSLLRNLTHLEDPESLAMLVLLAVDQGHPDQATRWAQRLREASSWVTSSLDTNLVLESLAMPGRDQAAQPTESRVEHLATEMIAAEPAIKVLIEAQQREPQPGAALLLAAAIERALPALRDPAEACEALARLALIHDDVSAAERWADCGLELKPMSAPLSMLREQARQRVAAAAKRTADAAAFTTERAA